jgi:hypothetical protein
MRTATDWPNRSLYRKYSDHDNNTPIMTMLPGWPRQGPRHSPYLCLLRGTTTYLWEISTIAHKRSGVDRQLASTVKANTDIFIMSQAHLRL